MGRDATKAAGNPWYQARKKAAEYDDRLCSRESAAEQLGMSVSSLADAELGNTKFMPVDKAVLMADRYNAPWLLNHYCLNECPIGCRHSLSDEVVGIDRVTVKLLKSLKTEKLGDVKDTLLDIAADGKITEDEKPALQEVLAYRAASFFGRMNCPDMIMGIYSQEEVLDMGDIPTDGFALVVDPSTGEVTEAEKDEPITQDQRQTLFKMATSAFGQEANGVLKSLLAAEGYESTEGLPTSVYHRITEKVMEMAQEKKPEPEAPQEASDTVPASDQPDFPGKE